MRKRELIALLFAALAVAARLPFLMSGRIAFDSDEAVEGLMARHVLNGEFPAFLWGQAFKGVPEVYAAAGAFAVFGPGVAVLKSVTLAFFSAYVALNFVLLDKIADRWIASAASLLLIVAPPALVFWSLDASAEYILTMLVGTAFLLLCLRYQREPSRAILGSLGLVTGLGLWIHQIFVIYLMPVALILLVQSDWWKGRGTSIKGTFRAPVLVLGAIASLYVALAAIAFATGGFSLQLGSLTLAARAPQKMLRIALAVGMIAAVAQVLMNSSRETIRLFARRYWPLAAGFLIGYAPVIIFSLFVEPARSPVRVANFWRLMGAAPDIFGNVIPILSGFKIATTERLPIPIAAAAAIVAALIAYVWSVRQRLLALVRFRSEGVTIADDFFPIFILFVPLLFVASGAYLDTQSYRYLIPYYAGLAVALAAGSLVLGKGDRMVATVVVGTLLTVFALQQFAWYQKLSPDTDSARVIDCLQREGVRGGYADYWTSYKLTFLSNEKIVFAPTGGVDRYPAYTEFVRSLPSDARLDPDHCK